jgi:NAD(P)H-dependent FMN reductase
MIHLMGLSGSLRHESYNTRLLNAARELAPEGCELSVYTVHGIPLYDGDSEVRDGIPKSVVTLKNCLAAADGLLVATPEFDVLSSPKRRRFPTSLPLKRPLGSAHDTPCGGC